MSAMTQPPHLPDDGRQLPLDSVAAQVVRDAALCAAAYEVALRHDAAITAWFLRRLEKRLV
jgi:hypothetical protein